MLEDIKVISAYSPDTLCMNCMQNKESSQALCLHCGYDERKYKEHPLYLKPKTILKNQYLIGNPLGQGGFGITYVGLDKWLQKKIALKEFLPSTLATRNFLTSEVVPVKKQETAFKDGLRLFINEARHLAKFDHPNIVRVINFFEENQTGYMVMDYLEGDNPMHILNQAGGKLPVHTALAILLPILDALIEIHAHHIYHLDISMQNIRILKSGIPILIDFGAARHIVGEYSHSLDLVLKHGYSPLEQYSRKGKIGPWTDVYASGALLYFLVTGHLPPAATDRFCEDSLVAPQELLGEEIPEAVSQAMMRALAMRSEDRFQSIGEFKAALQGQAFILSQIPSTASSPSHFGVARILGVLGLIIALGGVLYSIHFEWVDAWFKQFTWLQAGSIPEQSKNIETTSSGADILKKIAVYHQQARLAQEKGRINESLQQVEQGLQLMPHHAELRALKQVLLKQKQLNEHLQHIQSLLKEALQSVHHFHLENAYALYQKILTLEPSHPEAQRGLEHVAQAYLQLVHQKQENISESLSLLKKALLLFPQNLDFLSLQKELLAQQREREEKLVQQRKIDELLKKASQQHLALRLTEPLGNNAYETYLQILAMDPHHPLAQQGITSLADEYEKLARIKQNDSQKNLALIDKGLKISPHHSGLLALRQTFIEQKHSEETAWVFPKKPIEQAKEISSPQIFPQEHNTSQQVTRTEQKPSPPEKVTQPRLDVAEKSSQSELEKYASHPSPKTEPSETKLSPTENQIQNLLTLAQQQLELNQWEDSAKNYQNILNMETNHLEARMGLQRIVQHYEQLARKKEQQGQLVESLEVINKGLSINPTHEELLTLRKEIEQRLKKSRERSSPDHIIFTPSF